MNHLSGVQGAGFLAEMLRYKRVHEAYDRTSEGSADTIIEKLDQFLLSLPLEAKLAVAGERHIDPILVGELLAMTFKGDLQHWQWGMHLLESLVRTEWIFKLAQREEQEGVIENENV